MSIAPKLASYLEGAGVTYEVIEHPETPSASRTAQAAHAPGDRVAKGVLLRDDQGYLLAVVPSTHQVDLDWVAQLTGRRLELATEAQIGEVFTDCAVGAVPPIGPAYGLEMVVDESLAQQPDVYLEAGDHRRLIHVNASDFARITAGARRGTFSHHV